jgi:hypothetical protein
MTFDATGLLIFLLAIIPGFVAQQSRHSISPRSVQEKTLIEETGEYVLNSVFIHLSLVLAFRLTLPVLSPYVLTTLDDAITQKKLLEWGWQHYRLVTLYYIISLSAGIPLGLFRGVLSLNQPVRKLLLRSSAIRWLLIKMGVFSFLLEEPVWYGVLRQQRVDELTFVEVKMKGNGGFYTGELRNFAILADSEREKDFFLVNVFYKLSDHAEYTPLAIDGVLLNFADVESIQVMKRPLPK